MAAISSTLVTAPGSHRMERRALPPPVVKSGVGLILVDQNLRPLYFDQQSLRILTYPDAETGTSASVADIQRQLRRVLGVEWSPADPSPFVAFHSGRRRYLCRAFPLRSWLENNGMPMVALLLERQHRTWGAALSDARRRFNLSQRETETVQHLVHGLTTKEIASRMDVSPNTVKQFVRLIMSKMGVTTRAGILGKAVPG